MYNARGIRIAAFHLSATTSGANSMRERSPSTIVTEPRPGFAHPVVLHLARPTQRRDPTKPPRNDLGSHRAEPLAYLIASTAGSTHAVLPSTLTSEGRPPSATDRRCKCANSRPRRADDPRSPRSCARHYGSDPPPPPTSTSNLSNAACNCRAFADLLLPVRRPRLPSSPECVRHDRRSGPPRATSQT